MPADLPSDLLARAVAHGLTRDRWGRWCRLGTALYFLAAAVDEAEVPDGR